MNRKIHRVFHSTARWRFGYLTFASALCWLASALGSPASATVYRWEDDRGTTHYSEIVPEQYQSVAKPVDVTRGNPAVEQRRDALARAQKEKDKAKAASTETQQPPLPASAPLAAPAPALKRPARVPDEQTDCGTWQRLYQESMECFGPYRTVHGIKPEAFEACNVVAEPPANRCRMSIP